MRAWAALLLLSGLAVAATSALADMPSLQNRLLYFPARARAEDVAIGGLRIWPAANDFRGLTAEPAEAARATAIVFHGNAGHAGHRAYYAAALVPIGVRVVLAEYPGYGPRGGDPGEKSFIDDAVQSIDLALRLHGAPLIVVGESLGAAVAAAASAKRPDKVAGVLLITPWDRLEGVATHHYPWLPVRWLLRDRYDSARYLAAFPLPVVVAVADRDAIVPARFGRALHDALPGPKRLAIIEGAGHNDWIDRVGDVWWRETLAFLLAAPPR